MPFLYDDTSGLELFLSRVRWGALGAVPAYLALMFFLTKEEGWHWSFLVLCVLPPIAAFLGHRASRDIHAGLALGALALAVAPFPLVAAVELL